MSFTEMDMQGGTLEAAALRSVHAAADVGALDEAIVEILRRYARAIDVANEGHVTCQECGEDTVLDANAISRALYLGPHYVNALRELGLTPAARNQAKPSDRVDPRDEALDELESRRRGAKRAP